MGMAMGAASMFFPPLGLASAAMGNLLGNAMGKAVSGAIAQMVQNMGMPNTTGNLIKQIVGDVIGKLQQQVGQQVQDQVGQKFENALKDFQQQFMRDLMQEVEKLVGKKTGGAASGSTGAGAAGGTATGTDGGESWFVAIAVALGRAADKQMVKVKELATELNGAVKASEGQTGDKLQQQGMKFQEISGKINAESKILEVMTSTMNNLTKSVGDALVSAAKRQ